MKKSLLFFFITLSPIVHSLSPVSAPPTEPKVEVITEQLDQPWSLAFLPNNQFLVTEKSGQLRIVDSEGNVSSPIKGLPKIKDIRQGGLLDVVLHPQFKTNHYIYLSFVAGNVFRGYNTEVIRGTLKNNRLTNVKKIFVALPKSKRGIHFGSRLLFKKGEASSKDQYYLYISLGDRGVRLEAQNLSNHHGSIIRLHDNGDIPSDNPFVNTPNAKPEIYSYGHRNIQGLALDTVTNQIWAHEHGPQGGDELNHIQAGKNYGWPTITYGVDYGIGTKIGEGTEKPGLEQPEHYWDPSIAPSGLAIYQQNKSKKWLIGALKFQLLAVLEKDKQANRYKEQRYIEGQYGRIRDVRVNDKNEIYLLTNASQGKLLKLSF